MIDAKRFTDLFDKAAACNPDVGSTLTCAIASYNEDASNAATGQGLTDEQIYEVFAKTESWMETVRHFAAGKGDI